MGATVRLSEIEGPPPLPALREVRTPRHATTLARVLVALGLAVVLALFVPWQQSSSATGRVVAWDPNDRQQTIEAPIEGRVVRVEVVEGTFVHEGDVLLEIADNDPELVARLETERQALEDRVTSARAAVLEMEGRVLDLQESRMRAAAAAEQRVQMAVDRRIAAEQRVIEAEAQRARDAAQLERREAGAAEGLASQRDLEVAQADAKRSDAALEQARAAASAAGAEEQAAREDLARIDAEADANVASARAARDQAEMTEQSAVADLARVEVRLARQSTQVVKAPRDGRVLRVLANPNADLLKPGDPLVVLIPDTEERAVELWVDGRDLPFLAEGAEVRLQFEGWPALQFVGIPGASAGTFGGVVSLVDPAGDPDTGQFRVLVVPEPGGADWPAEDRLRQGTRAAGWVLLGQVPLGFELWRQLNGFPPSPSKAKGEPDAGVSRGKK
jgi:adhesin transport system membrane fusion protein